MSSYARQERAARRFARELAQQQKERAKLDEQGRARLAVQTYENRIDQLTSIHREAGPSWDWARVACSLSPRPPENLHGAEFKVRQKYSVLAGEAQSGFEAELEAACKVDEQKYQAAVRAHQLRSKEWEKLTALAARMCRRDTSSYQEAMESFSPLAELAELGSDIEFEVYSTSLVKCTLSTNGQSVVPAETRSLTTTGKLSEKATPRGRFHEIYQDYVCGSVLRVMREVFALLPVDHVLVTAVAPVFEPGTGTTANQPVLSVIASREDLAVIQWENVDPSDAVDRLLHRGDFKASRKSGAFSPIEPLRPESVEPTPGKHGRLAVLLAKAGELQTELKSQIAENTQP